METLLHQLHLHVLEGAGDVQGGLKPDNYSEAGLGWGVDYAPSYLDPDETRPRIRWQELLHVLEHSDRVKVSVSDGDSRHSCSALLVCKSTFAEFYLKNEKHVRLADQRL